MKLCIIYNLGQNVLSFDWFNVKNKQLNTNSKKYYCGNYNYQYLFEIFLLNYKLKICFHLLEFNDDKILLTKRQASIDQILDLEHFN